MSQTVDLNTFDVGTSFPQFSFGQFAVALGTPDEAYTIRVTDMLGNVLAELTTDDPTDRAQAFPGDVVDTLNAPQTFDITFPKYAFTKADVDLLGNATDEMQVQVLLGDEVIAWGPAIGESGGSGSGSVTLQCAGRDWYFPKRAIDEEPVNMLSFGGFENGDFAGWKTSGSWHGDTIGDESTATIETDNVFQGTYAARVTTLFATTGLALVSNPATFTSGPIGNFLGLTFSACIELFLSIAGFGAAVILIAGPPGSNGAPQGGVNAKESAIWRIDDTTPTNTEIREALQIFIPPNKTWAAQVVFYSPNGVTVVDHFFLAPLKRLTTAFLVGTQAAVDVSQIARMIFDHTLSDLHHHGKSNLHIGLVTPDCGVKQHRVYEFVDHTPVDQAFGEFLDRDDCFDYQLLLTATTCTLQLYPVTDGGLGTDYDTDVVLTYKQAPFASYTTNLDGGSAATKIAELGDGSGAVREEGWYTDESQIGGTTLQDTIAAPEGAPFNSLTPLARSAVSLRRKAAEVIEVTITREPGGYVPDDTVILQDLLEVGDRLTLDIADGWHTYDGKWRIVRRARHCRPRTMTYTLNRVAA